MLKFQGNKAILHYYDENNDVGEIEMELPTRMEVCPKCEGHGTHLCDGMRGYAYSMEEFHESFDDEEREEYFRRGGRYDVTCTECYGKNVVLVVDEKRCSSKELRALHDYYHEEGMYRQLCEAERRAGC